MTVSSSTLLVFTISLTLRFVSIASSPTTTKMSVTPPFPLEQNSCYSKHENDYLAEISSGTSNLPSLFGTHCSQYRKCFPSTLKDNFFLPEGYASFKSIEPDLAKGFMPSLIELESREDDAAQKCLHYGRFFVCNVYYPMCFQSSISNMKITPCRQLCESTLSHCRNALPPVYQQFLNDSSVFNCDQYEESSLTSNNARCLENVTDGCTTEAPPVTTAVPTEAVSPITTPTEAAPTEVATEAAPTETPTEARSTPGVPTEATQPTMNTTSANTTSANATKTRSCKRLRNSYSRNVILDDKKTYQFFAFVRVLEKFTAVMNKKEMIAYNATLLKDYDLGCLATHVCSSNVTIYTTDDEDCNLVSTFIDETDWNINMMIAGGTVTEKGQWILDNYDVRCVISPYNEQKDKKKVSKINRNWFKTFTCRSNGAQRQPCGV